jgi:hypothetical protein
VQKITLKICDFVDMQATRRSQQRSGLDNNFASDRDCDSTTTTRLRHHRLRRIDRAAPDKS